MNETDTALQTYFNKLGLDREIADIYIALHKHGAQTISELSRHSHVERTQVYRLLPVLTDNNLIEVQSDYKRGIIKAAPFANIQILLTKKEQEFQDLKDNMPFIEKALGQQADSLPQTKIQFYRGIEGIRQMLWNETKAKGEIVGILYENIQVKTKSKFFERWVERCNQSDIHFRGVISDTFITSQNTWYQHHTNERLNRWHARYVSEELFPITHSTFVYNDVTAYFHWDDTEVFGVEIYNQQIADTQRQLFELLWKISGSKEDV